MILSVNFPAIVNPHVEVYDGPKVLLRADVSPATASVTVPRGACTRQPVPS